MNPKIKICGITSLEDGRFCAGAGASFLGFIQQPESPRFVKASVAKEIISWIHGVNSVGVFVDQDLDEVNLTAVQAGFDFVQLHGSESPAYCKLMELPVIKTIHVTDEDSSSSIFEKAASYTQTASFLLFDTGGLSVPGGSGKSFNWDVIANNAWPLPIFLAGGINVGNIQKAIDTVRPFAIDISSGVESSPGIKAYDKVTALFDKLRRSAR